VGVVLYNAWWSIEEFAIAWLLKIIAIESRFVLGLYRRQMKAISYLGRIEKRLGVAIEKVVSILKTGSKRILTEDNEANEVSEPTFVFFVSFCSMIRFTGAVRLECV